MIVYKCDRCGKTVADSSAFRRIVVINEGENGVGSVKADSPQVCQDCADKVIAFAKST